MPDSEPDLPDGVRNYEKRTYRHRRMYWGALVPIVLVVGGGYALGHPQDALLIAVLGVLVIMLVMLREMVDILGYLGSVQRKAADDRSAIRQQLADLQQQLKKPG